MEAASCVLKLRGMVIDSCPEALTELFGFGWKRWKVSKLAVGSLWMGNLCTVLGA